MGPGRARRPWRQPGSSAPEKLWEPLLAHLGSIQTVLISPDGPLCWFPWAALPGRDPDQYLIEEGIQVAVIPVPQLIPELLAAHGRHDLRRVRGIGIQATGIGEGDIGTCYQVIGGVGDQPLQSLVPNGDWKRALLKHILCRFGGNFKDRMPVPDHTAQTELILGGSLGSAILTDYGARGRIVEIIHHGCEIRKTEWAYKPRISTGLRDRLLGHSPTGHRDGEPRPRRWYPLSSPATGLGPHRSLFAAGSTQRSRCSTGPGTPETPPPCTMSRWMASIRPGLFFPPRDGLHPVGARRIRASGQEFPSAFGDRVRIHTRQSGESLVPASPQPHRLRPQHRADAASHSACSRRG